MLRANIAQLVEQQFRKLQVKGSSPFIGSIFEVWLSLVERCVRDAEVAGSNPVAPILKTPQIVSDLWGFVCLCKNFRLLFR